MANFAPNNQYVNSVGWTAVAAWTALTPYAAGALVRQLATPATNSERVFVCITAGTSLAAEPTWTTTKGGVTTEAAGPVWQECTGQPGVNGDVGANSPTWTQQHTQSATIVVGLIIQDATGSGSVNTLWIAKTGTTIGASNPFTGNANAAGTSQADNAVTWISLGPASNFGTWAAPHARLANAYTSGWTLTTGSNTFVSDNHAETQASAMSTTFLSAALTPAYVYCIDHTVNLPPTSSNLKTTATITTTGNFGITLLASAYVYLDGLIFQSGTGANSTAITISTTSQILKLTNCQLQKLSTTANNSAMTFGSGYADLSNTTMTFSAAGDGITLQNATLRWQNTASAIGGTVPSSLFRSTASSSLEVDGVDLSAITGSLAFNANDVHGTFTNCLFASPAPTLGSGLTIRSWVPTDTIFCDSTGSTEQFQRFMYQGSLTNSASIYRTGGASNGVTGFSRNIATSTGALWVSPFETPPIVIWNTVTGTNRVVTMYGIVNAANLPNNDQVWMSAEYLGNAGSPLASYASGTKANGLAAGTTLTADSSSQWVAPARANTTSYTTASAPVSVASNANLIFFCISNGTSAGSLPGAYATATDGQSVTDGSATFRACTRFSLSVTLSTPQPQLVGDITGRVRAAQASTTFYIDPLITLS